MIICTRCGFTNGDVAPVCQSCGHKLQSQRRFSQPDWTPPETLRPLRADAQGERFRGMLWRCLEVWAVAAVTLGITAWGLAWAMWWPGLVGVGLGGVYLFLRRRG